MDIGKRVKELRKERNITAEELAKLCNVSQPVVSKLENNHRVHDVPTLKKICEVLDITLADFFAPENSSMPLEKDLEELLNNAKELNSEQIRSLTNFLKTITGDNK